MTNQKHNASEALFGMLSWLSTRKRETVLSSKDNCSELPILIDRYIKKNNLPAVRSDWEKHFEHPDAIPEDDKRAINYLAAETGEKIFSMLLKYMNETKEAQSADEILERLLIELNDHRNSRINFIKNNVRLETILADYCGESDKNEGAVETLNRLLTELHTFRQQAKANT